MRNMTPSIRYQTPPVTGKLHNSNAGRCVHERQRPTHPRFGRTQHRTFSTPVCRTGVMNRMPVFHIGRDHRSVERWGRKRARRVVDTVESRLVCVLRAGVFAGGPGRGNCAACFRWDCWGWLRTLVRMRSNAELAPRRLPSRRGSCRCARDGSTRRP